MPSAFEQHSRANGGSVAIPRPVDAPTPGDGAHTTWEAIPDGEQTWQPAGRATYDQAMPGFVASPLYHLTQNEDTAGLLEGDPGRVDESNGSDQGRAVDITRYIDRNVGGTTGAKITNGWTSGLSTGTWNAHHFKGRAVQLQSAQAASIRPGPVGRIPYGANLAAGVSSQFEVPPSLEDIYRSIVNRGPA
jgi:hypothetical protein